MVRNGEHGDNGGRVHRSSPDCWCRPIEESPRVWVHRDVGPEDEVDPCVNGDGDSMAGEDDEAGYDDMPVEFWEDEEEDDGDEEEADDGEIYDEEDDEE